MLQIKRGRTLDQVRVFVEGSEVVDFTGPAGVGLRVRAPGAWCGWTPSGSARGFRRIFSRIEKLDVIFPGFIVFALIFDALR